MGADCGLKVVYLFAVIVIQIVSITIIVAVLLNLIFPPCHL